MQKTKKIHVRTGQYQIAENPVILITFGLGSCVAVPLYDEAKKLGGMLHFLLPENPKKERTSKYADSGIQLLLEKTIEFGANPSMIKAKIIGGAVMFVDLLKNKENAVGKRNAEKAREILKSLKIPIVGEDIGGDYGRSVEFNLSNGSVRINSYSREEKII